VARDGAGTGGRGGVPTCAAGLLLLVVVVVVIVMLMGMGSRKRG